MTIAASRWLLDRGAGPYHGPVPPPGHDTAPLLSTAPGDSLGRLRASAFWIGWETCLLPVLTALSEMGHAVTAFKGIDYVYRIYPEGSLRRPASDVDLLVDRESGRALDRILGRMGWIRHDPGEPLVASGLVGEVKYTRHGRLLELHYHPLYFPCNLPGRLPENILDGSDSTKHPFPGMRLMSLPDALLLHLLQMAYTIPPRQMWWIDLALLAARMGVDSPGESWRRFAIGARATRAGLLLRSILEVAIDCLGLRVPSAVMSSMYDPGSDRSELVSRIARGRRGIPTFLAASACHDWRLLPFVMSTIYRIATGRPPQGRRRNPVRQGIATER